MRENHHIFEIKNDEGGKAFWFSLLKMYNKKNIRLRRRGRGTRKNGGDQLFLPLDKSEWWAVYAEINADGRWMSLNDIDFLRRKLAIEENKSNHYRNLSDEVIEANFKLEEKMDNELTTQNKKYTEKIYEYIDELNNYKKKFLTEKENNSWFKMYMLWVSIALLVYGVCVTIIKF